ncbi:6-bladed beta-propeller [Algoriphagus boritolerans]|uniref:6-bladed beta-propeller n=1 Tax=Algoriphagus boritolerans TaxID=308111 RepID=UPI003A0FDF3A
MNKKKVQVFDTQGNHLFEIKASGAGPGQFKTPNLVRINQVGDRILVYCSLTKKNTAIRYEWQLHRRNSYQ